MKVIIIDDEAQSHLALEALLKQKHPFLEILGNGYNVEEGYALIQKYSPDLVFLDIEMPSRTGFDSLEKFYKILFQITFVILYNQYAFLEIVLKKKYYKKFYVN